MLGANGAAEFLHDVMDDAIDFLPAIEKAGAVLTLGCAEIEMDVAVPQMPERHRPHTGSKLLHRLGTAQKKIRNGGNRQRYVMFDRPALMLLRLGQTLAQPPQVRPLGFAGRHDRICDDTIFYRDRKASLNRFPQT